MAIINEVCLTPKARKDLGRVPDHIGRKLMAWIAAVKHFGLAEVRKVPGYHDEPLKGQRAGERSIRLSRGYRAIYVIKKDGKVEFVSIEEVNLHDY